jgi:hypothetical protein
MMPLDVRRGQMKCVKVNWGVGVEVGTQIGRRLDGRMNGLLRVCMRGFENILLESG